MPGHPLVAPDRGALAVEFSGTLAAGPGRDADRLSSPSQLAAWLDDRGDRLPPQGPETTARLGRFRALRDAVRDLLEAAASDLPPSGVALETVNEASASAASYPVLGSPGIVHVRMVSGDATVAILGAIARSAIELLSGPDRDRIRACAAPGCGRLFVATRPGRTWCSNACGNRARVARHYARSRSRRSAS